MSTIELNFKMWAGDRDPVVIVEVNRDGDIISACEFKPSIDDWVDCTETIRNSEAWAKKIEKQFSELDWNDIQKGRRNDWALRQLREAAIEILGIEKKA